MILLRDFTLFVLPALIAAGGWLYAFGLRKQTRRSGGREVQRAVASCARTDVRKCS